MTGFDGIKICNLGLSVNFPYYFSIPNFLQKLTCYEKNKVKDFSCNVKYENKAVLLDGI